jgi:hypothetical protein
MVSEPPHLLPPSPAFPVSRYPAPLSSFFLFSPHFPFSFSFSPLAPFHHFPSEALPLGRGRAGVPPRLSPAPAALWREGAPSSPGHQRRRLEERDRRWRRRPHVRAHHGTSSLIDQRPQPCVPLERLRPRRPPARFPLFSLLSRPGRLSPRAAENEVVTGPNEPASPPRGLQLRRGGGRGGEGSYMKLGGRQIERV